MPLQFIKDNAGSTTAVIIPIDEWRFITTKHKDLKALEQGKTDEVTKKLKPSDLAGTLSEEGYEAINEHIKQARNEWDSTF